LHTLDANIDFQSGSLELPTNWLWVALRDAPKLKIVETSFMAGAFRFRPRSQLAVLSVREDVDIDWVLDVLTSSQSLTTLRFYRGYRYTLFYHINIPPSSFLPGRNGFTT
ncbi:hypothetical protein MPER_06795, partial [Moniliophthora perniciosa FA553]